MTTEDTVYQGRVHLVQPEQGFRAGTDSLLLAAALSCRPGGEALEVGCGCGGALLPAGVSHGRRLPDRAGPRHDYDGLGPDWRGP
jgi:hypothetical protein